MCFKSDIIYFVGTRRIEMAPKLFLGPPCIIFFFKFQPKMHETELEEKQANFPMCHYLLKTEKIIFFYFSQFQ